MNKLYGVFFKETLTESEKFVIATDDIGKAEEFTKNKNMVFASMILKYDDFMNHTTDTWYMENPCPTSSNNQEANNEHMRKFKEFRDTWFSSNMSKEEQVCLHDCFRVYLSRGCVWYMSELDTM